jgi:hypothetical protein
MVLFGSNLLRFAFGVLVNGHPFFGSAEHSGPVYIEENGIDVFGDDIKRDNDSEPIDFTSGIGISDYITPIEVYVTDNTIRNPGYNGIWPVGFYPTSKVTIEGNRIYQRKYAPDFKDQDKKPFWVAGINVYPHDLGPFGYFPVGTVDIIGNEIYDCISVDIEIDCDGAKVEDNVISGGGGIYPSFWNLGNNNTFTNNDFSQKDLKGFLVSSTGWVREGCILLGVGTSGITVNAYSDNFPVNHKCTQVADLSGANAINYLDFSCDSKEQDQLFRMIAQSQRFNELKDYLEERRLPPEDVQLAMQCINSGGTWNPDTKQCE